MNKMYPMSEKNEDRYNIKSVLLLDFYGRLLTDKAYEIADLYFNEDLSLSEISENLGISRQAVHDSLRRGVKSLNNYESKLGLMSRFLEQKKEIEGVLNALDSENIDLAKLKLKNLYKNI